MGLITSVGALQLSLPHRSYRSSSLTVASVVSVIVYVAEMTKYLRRTMFGAFLVLTSVLGSVSGVTTNLEGGTAGGCDGPSRCIRASECRRSIRPETPGSEREKVLFNCGFEGVSLLVCCPPEQQGTARSTTTTTTTSRPSVTSQTTPRQQRPVTITQRPVSTTSTIKVEEVKPFLSDRFPEFRPEIPMSQRTPTRLTTISTRATTTTARPTTTTTTKQWQYTERHVTKEPVRLSAAPFDYYKPQHHEEEEEEYHTERNEQSHTTKRPLVARPSSTENYYNFGMEQTTQQSRRPFEPPYIIDSVVTSAPTRPAPRPPPNFSSTYPGSNTVGSGESGPLWPASQHVQQPPRQSPPRQQTSETQDLTSHRNYRLLPQEICGTSAGGPNRIINGQNVTLGQFPWMALLGYKTSEAAEDFVSVCGGTLISWKYVLTAAHCLKNSVRVVRLGEHVITTQPDCDQDGLCADPVVDVEIELKIPHPSYGKPYLKNDIGLVRLRQAQPRLFSSYVRPICLPLEPEKQKPGRKLIIAGWGTTRRGSKFASDVLQMAVVPEIGLVECNDAQEDDVLKPVVASQMCAAVTDHHSTTCHGDSGGPLMDVQQSRSSLSGPVVVQLGIVSVGSDDCGLHGAPSIYTRVSSFTNWVLDTMQD
ncbi:hypothetical protein B566_EDAN008404 [Ephemera danica]|nr:hypothetical protein B566_EDAN008404 [Ephemera danica]